MAFGLRFPQLFDQELIDHESPLAEPDITLDELDRLIEEHEEEQLKKQLGIVEQSTSDPASSLTVQTSIDQDFAMQEVETALSKHNLSPIGQQTEGSQVNEVRQVAEIEASSSPHPKQHLVSNTNDYHQDSLDVIMTEELPVDGEAYKPSSSASGQSSKSITDDVEEHTSKASILKSTRLLQTTNDIVEEALKQGRLTPVTKEDNDKPENLHVPTTRKQPRISTPKSMRISALQKNGVSILEQQRDDMNAKAMVDEATVERRNDKAAGTMKDVASADQKQLIAQPIVPQKRKDKTLKGPRERKRLKDGKTESFKAPSSTNPKKTQKSDPIPAKEANTIMKRRTSSRLNPAIATKSDTYVAPSTRASRRSGK